MIVQKIIPPALLQPNFTNVYQNVGLEPQPTRESVMRALIIAVVLTFFCSMALAHGGGCRKDSPPGQCCHLETSTGIVHCH